MILPSPQQSNITFANPSFTPSATSTASSSASGSPNFANYGSAAMIEIIVGVLGALVSIVGLAVARYYRNRPNKSPVILNSEGSMLPLRTQEELAYEEKSVSTSFHI